MSGLVLRLKAEPAQRLDLSLLTPAHLAGLSEAQIAALPVGTTKEVVTLGDVFQISMGDVGSIRIEGGSARLDRLGEAMEEGEIVLDGDAGMRAGRLMSGGRLEITGSAGPFAGSGMSGGEFVIGGDAGERLGGPLAGEMSGMRGGLLRVRGRAGARAGDRMRRGTIVVEGDCGENAASRMIAGTLIVGGRTGATPGRLMRRGTLILAGGAETLSPTFMDNGPADLVILRLMARVFAAPPLSLKLFDGRPMRRFGGDTATMGLGEIFLPLG